MNSVDEHPEEIVFAWDDLCNVFDSLYVNWDPKIFKHQTNHHACVSISTSSASASAYEETYDQIMEVISSQRRGQR